tara:strand:- start:454 stop:759 length:306 start_codon:yes stop_codon:yes gene_type:complete
MEQVAFVLKLYPDKVEAYRKTHQAVWQEMIDANRAAGVRNHSCFLYGNLVFAYMECDNFESTDAMLEESDVVQEWRKLHSDIVDSSSGETRVFLEHVFHQE